MTQRGLEGVAMFVRQCLIVQDVAAQTRLNIVSVCVRVSARVSVCLFCLSLAMRLSASLSACLCVTLSVCLSQYHFFVDGSTYFIV